jgi:hypothetical protein
MARPVSGWRREYRGIRTKAPAEQGADAREADRDLAGSLVGYRAFPLDRDGPHLEGPPAVQLAF